MKRPYIIIHTHTAIDGNINYIAVPEFDAAAQVYQDISLTPGKQELNIQGYLNGKTSTEDNMTFYKKPELIEDASKVPEGDFIAKPDAEMYYFSIDPRGELAFNESEFSYGGVEAHIVDILTSKASNSYKDFLRRKGISYIIAGEERIDLNLMLDKLYNLLGIKRMMVGGGGSINWSFLQAGLVDEVSVVLAPIADGKPDAPRLFEAKEPYSFVEPRAFELKSVKSYECGTVWIRYTPKATTE